MKRRKFLIALGVVPPLVFGASCKGDEPNPPTIFTGYVIGEDGKPIEGTGFQFIGSTGGFSPRGLFDLETNTDAKGYYYLEQIIPKGTGSVNFQPTEGDKNPYPDGLYKRLCLVNGVYQNSIPWTPGQKNELNFKIVKR